MTRRFVGPGWRVAGSFGSWFLFTLCFTLLFLGSTVVMGLGGFCASGGPYQIETQCPDAVALFVPLSIPGGIAAVVVGVIFARGFGVPLLAWAWPILFLGLGAAFLIASAQPGGITFLVCGILFVLMGGFPLYLGLKADARELFLGSTDAFDTPFAGTGPRPSVTRLPRPRRIPIIDAASVSGVSAVSEDAADDPANRTPVVPALGHWTLSLGVMAAAVALGIYLANLGFAAV